CKPGLPKTPALATRRWQILRITVAVLLATAAHVRAEGAQQPAERVEFFEKKIRPVLIEHCYKCHAPSAQKVPGGLLLDSRDSLRKGGDSGPGVVPGNPAASRLLKALRYDELQMPPAGKLPDQVIADFETWIKHGAIDPRATAAPASQARKIDFEAAKQ